MIGVARSSLDGRVPSFRLRSCNNNATGPGSYWTNLAPRVLHDSDSEPQTQTAAGDEVSSIVGPSIQVDIDGRDPIAAEGRIANGCQFRNPPGWNMDNRILTGIGRVRLGKIVGKLRVGDVQLGIAPVVDGQDVTVGAGNVVMQIRLLDV